MPQQAAPEPAKTEQEAEQSDVIDDESFREMFAHAVVDAFAESPAWADGMRYDIQVGPEDIPEALVHHLAGHAPSVEMVEEFMAKDPAKISFKQYDQAARRNLQKWLRETKPYPTREAGKAVLDGLIGGAVSEIVPDPASPTVGKIQKPFTKGAQSAAGIYLEMAFVKAAEKLKAGASWTTAFGELRTLHRYELPESGLKEIASMFATAEAEVARITVVPVEKAPPAKVGNVAGAAEKKVGVVPPPSAEAAPDIFNPNPELHPKKPPVGNVAKSPGAGRIAEEAACWLVRLKVKRGHCP